MCGINCQICQSGNLFIKKVRGIRFGASNQNFFKPLLNLRFLPKRSLAMHYIFQMYSVDLSIICLSNILCLRGSDRKPIA